MQIARRLANSGLDSPVPSADRSACRAILGMQYAVPSSSSASWPDSDAWRLGAATSAASPSRTEGWEVGPVPRTELGVLIPTAPATVWEAAEQRIEAALAESSGSRKDYVSGEIQFRRLGVGVLHRFAGPRGAVGVAEGAKPSAASSVPKEDEAAARGRASNVQGAGRCVPQMSPMTRKRW